MPLNKKPKPKPKPVVNRDIVLSKFELQSYYYIHIRTNTFGKGINPIIPPHLQL